MKDAVKEIAQMIPRNRRSLPWWDRVSPEVARLLPGVLEAWRSGEFGSHVRPAAVAISVWLRKHGVEIQEQGVERWLRQNTKR